MKRFTIFFVLINLFLCSYYLDSWQNANTTSRVLPVLSIVDQGTMRIDSFADKTIDKSVVDGHYYCDKAPLPSFIVIPFYAALKATGLLNQSSDFDTYSKPVFILGSFICGSIPFLLICMIFYSYASRYTNQYNAAFLSMLCLYSSFIFIFSGTFFAHVLSATLLLLSYLFLKHEKRYFYSGLFLGLAFLSEFPIAFIIPIWTIQIYLNEKKIRDSVLFVLGVTPLILLMMLYNYSIMGSPFDSLYDHLANDSFVEAGKPLGFSFPSLSALWGLTLSLYRGVFIYCPLLIMPALFFLKDKKIFSIKWKTDYLAIVAICYFLLIASYRMWWGGWSYGPRQLMPIVVLLLFEGLIYVSQKKINTYLLFSLSILPLIITWIVKITVMYSVPTEIKNPFADYFFQDLFNKTLNPNNLLTMLFNLDAWSASLVWLLVFGVVVNSFLRSANKLGN